MNNYIESYIEYLVEIKNISKNTQMSYKNDLSKFIKYLQEQKVESFSQVNDTIMNGYVLEMEREGKSSATVARSIVVLRSFFLYLFKQHVIEDDPTERLKAPKVDKKEVTILTLEQVQQLLNEPNTAMPRGMRDKALLEVLYATGMKVSEIAELRLEDLDLERGIVYCQSAKKTRLIPMGNPAKEALALYLNEGRDTLVQEKDVNEVFVNRNGNPLSRQGIWKIMKHYGEMMGLTNELTPQILRHSVAVHMLENGASIKAVSEMLSFSDASFIQFYTRTKDIKILSEYKKAHPRA